MQRPQIRQPRQRREVGDLVVVEFQFDGTAFLLFLDLGEDFKAAVRFGVGLPFGPFLDKGSLDGLDDWWSQCGCIVIRIIRTRRVLFIPTPNHQQGDEHRKQ